MQAINPALAWAALDVFRETALEVCRAAETGCYQDMPQDLLPEALRDANTLRVPRLVDGRAEANSSS